MTIIFDTKTKVFLNTDVVPREYFMNDPSELVPDRPVEKTKLRFELVPGVGFLTYIKNATHPMKTMPAADVVYAINIIKEVIKQSFGYKTLFLYDRIKLLNSFNSVFDRAMKPYHLNHVYMCYAARMTWYSVSTFLQEIGIPKGLANDTGFHVAHIIEFDSAYRNRLQDIATECNLYAMQDNPRKELMRLFRILQSRDKYGMPKKMELYAKPLFLLLLIPKYNKAMKKIAKYFKQMEYDEMDWYWTAFVDNYKFGGKTHQERLKEVQVPEMFTSYK